MIKSLLIGLWACVVSLGAAYFGANYAASSRAGGEAASGLGAAEYIKTEMTSVPIIRGGKVEGYVVFQLVFAADAARIKHLSVEPAPYLIDEAFRRFYDKSRIDFSRIDKPQIDEITKSILDGVNGRLGEGMIKDVLLQQLNYVRREDIRTNWISEAGRGGDTVSGAKDEDGAADSAEGGGGSTH